MKSKETGANCKILNAAYHRNGISGVPFVAAIFEDGDGSKKLGIMFEDSFPENRKKGHVNPYVAVLDIDLLRGSNGTVEFGKNSWRGDYYVGVMDKACRSLD